MGAVRYWKIACAVVGGNLLYYGVLARLLPPGAQHRLYRFDWGLVVDFWVCLALYGVLELFSPKQKK